MPLSSSPPSHWFIIYTHKRNFVLVLIVKKIKYVKNIKLIYIVNYKYKQLCKQICPWRKQQPAIKFIYIYIYSYSHFGKFKIKGTNNPSLGTRSLSLFPPIFFLTYTTYIIKIKVKAAASICIKKIENILYALYIFYVHANFM